MDRVTDYFPSAQTVNLLKRLKPLFLVGPTGSGKDTIQSELLKTGKFHKLITYTTRQPRENHGQLEKDGLDYHFIDHETAVSMMKQQQFIEVTVTHNNLYGTGVDEFKKALKENKTPIADIDVKGVMAYRKLSKSFLAIFLLPDSFAELQARLVSRYGSSAAEGDIANRLRSALFELEVLRSTDYYYALINRDIKDTVAAILQILDGSYTFDRLSEESKMLASQLRQDIISYLNSI